MKKNLLLLMLMLVPLGMLAQAKEAYAVFNDGTLTFYYDESKSSREGTTYSLNEWTESHGVYFEEVNGMAQMTYTGSPDWRESASSITKVVFDSSFASARPATTFAWFYGCSNLTEIVNIEILNTEDVKDMSSMFEGCYSLTSLNVSNFDTSNVTVMSNMFAITSLKSLDVSNFNTSNLTNMRYMFYDCSGLKELNVSNFCTDKVKDMQGMFYGCSSLETLDVSNFNTENVTCMGEMFEDCSSLTALDVSNFDTNNVTDMNNMFSRCSSLTKLTSNFTNKNATSLLCMFQGCSNLRSIDLSSIAIPSWAMQQNYQYLYMFQGVSPSSLIYLPKGTKPSDFEGDDNGGLTHEPYNIVLTDADGNSTCEELRLTDEDELTIITTPFTAEKVSYSRAFTEGQKSTVYLPFAFDASAFGKVYDFKGMNDAGNGIKFSAISGTTNANTPYILKPNGAQITAENVLVERPVKMEAAGGNAFLGVVEAGFVPNGAFCYDASDGKLKKVVSDNGVKIGAGRGYFVLEGASTSAASKGIDVVFEDGTATGIGNELRMNDEKAAASPKYNLQGQRVGDSYKGLIIVNGKKITVK